jgi:hypothetical protein
VPAGRDGGDDVTDALSVARGSGFHRPRWTMLGLGALCRSLQGRPDEAAELLDELADSWSAVPALASGEWIPAAATAAALAGRDASVRVRGMLERVGHRTPWAEAALRTVTAAVAAADGDEARAGQLYAAAAGIYGQIPDTTDRMVTLALAADAFRQAGERSAAEVALTEVRAFAARNKAPGLLRLAGDTEDPAWTTPTLAS